MGTVKISCPHCGFSKDVPGDALPKGAFKVNCPKCKESFVQKNEAAQVPAAPPQAPPQEAARAAAPEPPHESAAKAADIATITCPHCGFSKAVPAASLPKGPFKITCPKCKQASVQGQKQEAPEAAPAPPPPPEPPRMEAPATSAGDWPPMDEPAEPADESPFGPGPDTGTEEGHPLDSQEAAGTAAGSQDGSQDEDEGFGRPRYADEMDEPLEDLQYGSDLNAGSGGQPPAEDSHQEWEEPSTPSAPEPAPEYGQPEPAPAPVAENKSTATVSCPHCGYSKDVPKGMIPEGASVTCPKCGDKFKFSESARLDAPRAGASAGGTQPPSRPAYEPEGGITLAREPRRERSSSPPPPPPGQGYEEEMPSRMELSGVGELLSEAWGIYKERMGTYLVLMLLGYLPVIAVGVGAGVTMGLNQIEDPSNIGIVQAVVLLIGIIVAMVFYLWSYLAMIHAITDDSLGVKDALGQSSSGIFSFIWVMIMSGVLIMVGFVLLVVPGVIIAVFLFCTVFVFVAEQARGTEALSRSKKYVDGQWGAVFWRLVVIMIMSIIVSLIPFIGGLISILFTPFMTVYMYLIYRELREIKGSLA